jgi:hypothetical protein
MCGMDRSGGIGTGPMITMASPRTTRQSALIHDKSQVGNTSFFSFLTCNGCSPNNPTPGSTKTFANQRIINDYPMMDEYESIVVKNKEDVNFLS